ncbi:MAG TPA: hypothetical protein VGL59_07700 [Polyangia bacterium]|jgi:hypothetical protein
MAAAQIASDRLGGLPILAGRKRSGPRLAALDTLRGALLVLILVSHGFGLLAGAAMTRTSREAIELLFGVATPSFVLISGTLFGFFLKSRADLSDVFRGYRRRAWLFFGLGHVLLAVELYPLYGGGSFWAFYLSRWYITDSLGVAFLLMPAVLPSLRPRYRVAIGAVMLLVSRLDVVLPWSAAGSARVIVLHQVFFGRPIATPRSVFDCYPLVPIVADFIVGSFIGDRLARALQDGRQGIGGFVQEVRRLILPLALLSAAICGAWALVASHFPGHPVLQALLFPDRSFSLFPAYLAWYLGALCFLLTYVDAQHRADAPVIGGLALLGRRSLFVFVAQYFVVQTLPAMLGHRWMSLRGLMLFLPFAVAAVYAATAAWDRLRQPRAPRARPPTQVTVTR